ncbi:hypothetical protein Tco_0731263 [Tanacetum coccineum]
MKQRKKDNYRTKFDPEEVQQIMMIRMLTLFTGIRDSIWEHDDDLEEAREDDGNDRNTFDIWDITVEDVERIRKFFTPNIPDVI